jgi:hypothetical protein
MKPSPLLPFSFYGLLLVGCMNGGDPVTADYRDRGVVRESIQEGARLAEVTPGEGVGVFVEYDTGGFWDVSTTCDTQTSEMACEWDVYLSTLNGDPPQVDTLFGMAEDDTVETTADGVVLRTVTDFELEGAVVLTEPGAILRVEVALDAAYADADPNPEQWVYWVGADGVARWGAPSNPVDLEPTLP